MHIGVYHDSVGTKHAGGVSIYARRLAIALAADNDVTVYTQDRDEVVSELVESPVDVVETPNFDVPTLGGRVSSRVGWPLPFGSQDCSKLAMITWSTRNGVIDHIDDHLDVLVTFQLPDDLLLSNLVDVPTVNGFPSDGSVGFGAKLHRRYSKTDAYFAISPYLAETVADRLGYEIDDVVLPGLDVEQFNPDAEPAFDADGPTILFVGRVVEAKGVLDLLEAVAQLDADVQVRIVGTGHAESAVERRRRQLGIADRVTLEGEVPHGDLPGYYTAADVFCLPTHVDSFAMVNLEAMGCGTPVVTTDLEAIETYLTPDENGITVPSGDPDALADALADVLTDPIRREVLGQRARRRAHDFSWVEQAAKLERVCAEAAGVERPAAAGGQLVR